MKINLIFVKAFKNEKLSVKELLVSLDCLITDKKKRWMNLDFDFLKIFLFWFSNRGGKVMLMLFDASQPMCTQTIF